MTLAEAIALVKSLSDTVGGLTKQVAEHQARIATLEAQVAKHDTELKPAPPPGPKGN